MAWHLPNARRSSPFAAGGRIQNLYQDFLIRVTQFFRDPEAFERTRTYSRTKNRPTGAPDLGGQGPRRGGVFAWRRPAGIPRWQAGSDEAILATDLNEAALEKARAGVYLDNIEIDVSQERLRRFLHPDGHYHEQQRRRELCVLSRHNMRPTRRSAATDLVSTGTRSLRDAALQKRVMPLLHYALNPHGVLFLGSSENAGGGRSV